jgi:hypothetical protein
VNPGVQRAELAGLVAGGAVTLGGLMLGQSMHDAVLLGGVVTLIALVLVGVIQYAQGEPRHA